MLRGERAELAAWQSELDRLYDPRRLVLGIPADAAGLPAALGDKRPGRELLAYVCRGMQCGAPVESLPALIDELRGRPEGGA